MAIELWAPRRFRFTEEADVAAYGDDWWTWDEAALTRLRGRELAVLEDAVDLSVPLIMQMLRGESTLGKLAAMWIALHMAGHDVKYADFNPVALAVRWEESPPSPLDGSGEDPAPDSGSSEATPPSPESATS